MNLWKGFSGHLIQLTWKLQCRVSVVPTLDFSIPTTEASYWLHDQTAHCMVREHFHSVLKDSMKSHNKMFISLFINSLKCAIYGMPFLMCQHGDVHTKYIRSNTEKHTHKILEELICLLSVISSSFGLWENAFYFLKKKKAAHCSFKSAHLVRQCCKEHAEIF